jgi:hypothetical protein
MIVPGRSSSRTPARCVEPVSRSNRCRGDIDAPPHRGRPGVIIESRAFVAGVATTAVSKQKLRRLEVFDESGTVTPRKEAHHGASTRMDRDYASARSAARARARGGRGRGGPFPSDHFTVPDNSQNTGLRVTLPKPD